eukprot:m.122862 g.122862  ORF g.122862 m.122862 type:complete len:289 (+) comp14435_c0_seq3:1369-2235(+)
MRCFQILQTILMMGNLWKGEGRGHYVVVLDTCHVQFRYVRLRVLDGLKTKHMRSSTVTGGKWTEWMERAEFLIESSNPILEVYVGEQAHRHFGVLFNADANTLDGSDKCIGSIKIPIYDKKAFPSDTTCRNQHLLIPPGPESDAATAYAVALGMKLELSITISSIGDEPLSHKSPIIQNNAWQLFPQVAGMLELEIIQATRLPAKDIDGTSDPYAVVQLGSTRLRTATKPGTLEPKWLKTFYIPVVDIFDTLEVSVFDEDPVEFFGFNSLLLLIFSQTEWHKRFSRSY